MTYTPEQKKRMIATARHTGAVSKTLPLCWQYFLQIAGLLPPGAVMDYGCGPLMKQAMLMRGLFPSWTFKTHDLSFDTSFPGPNSVDITIASNVLNVQPSAIHMGRVLSELRFITRTNGLIVLNYPASPRHAGLSRDEFEAILADSFQRKPFFNEGRLRAVYVLRNSKR